jgi:hypothetical protein
VKDVAATCRSNEEGGLGDEVNGHSIDGHSFDVAGRGEVEGGDRMNRTFAYPGTGVPSVVAVGGQRENRVL